MDRTIIFAFVMIFIALLLFMIFNTVMGEYFFPTFTNISSDMPNSGIYADQANILRNYFYLALYLMIIIPFLYILVRLLLKREPETVYAGYGGYGGQ